MSSSSLLVALAATLTGQLDDAPDRLMSEHGVELVFDGRVFVFFSALNGLGYAEENRRKGPPLEAPEYHAIRVEVREALRKDAAKLGALKSVLESEPAAIETYLAVLLAAPGLEKAEGKLGPSGERLKRVLSPLRELGRDPAFVGLFDKLGEAQHDLGKALKVEIERGCRQASERLRLPGLFAPPSLYVVPNPLDAHDSVRRVEVGGRRYLVLGPGSSVGPRAVLEEILRARAEGWATEHLAKNPKIKKAWDAVRVSPRIAARYPSAEAYLADSMARSLAFLAVGSTKDEEEFVEREAQEGRRWARAILRAVQDEKSTQALDAAMPAVFARINL